MARSEERRHIPLRPRSRPGKDHESDLAAAAAGRETSAMAIRPGPAPAAGPGATVRPDPEPDRPVPAGGLWLACSGPSGSGLVRPASAGTTRNSDCPRGSASDRADRSRSGSPIRPGDRNDLKPHPTAVVASGTQPTRRPRRTGRRRCRAGRTEGDGRPDSGPLGPRTESCGPAEGILIPRSPIRLDCDRKKDGHRLRPRQSRTGRWRYVRGRWWGLRRRFALLPIPKSLILVGQYNNIFTNGDSEV